MQNVKILAVVVGLGTAMIAGAQDGASDPVLMRVDGKPVTRSEFEAIYKKNNKDAPVTRQALDEYMDLFINYKLKVREAESMGMDTVGKFTQELAGYREQLARPYLIDRELNDNLIREAYDRSKVEVRAAHILVKCDADAAPEDTLKAFKRISELRARVLAGEDFGAIARKDSDDPSAVKNSGDLGWFSALRMVYPFENAAYGTDVGQVSPPVRTQFGYHILKVEGKREARGEIKVAHIMLRSAESDGPERQAEVERKINEIHGMLASGTLSFVDAALKYSEDEGTNTKGGELPMFSTGKMIEEFEDASFALRNDGDISAPFKSRYGWHIVKRLEYKPVPGFDQARNELKARISRDSRAEITRTAFLDKLKKEYHFTPYPANLKAVYPLVDSTVFFKGNVVTDTLVRREVKEGEVLRNGIRFRREISGMIKDGKPVNIRSRKYDDLPKTEDDSVLVRDVQEGWQYDRKKAAKLTKPVFTFDGHTYTQQDLLSYIEEKQKREHVMSAKELVDQRFAQMTDDKVLAYEDSRLEQKYPEFDLLMKEYRDGILLFELTDEKVWSRAVKDTSGLEAFYEANKMDFMWDTRYEAVIYTCADATVAKQVRALYKKGKRGDEIATEVNKGSSLALNVETGRWTAEEKPFLKGILKPGLTDNFDLDGRIVIVDMKEVVPPRPKTLDEARGLVTASYQDALEKEWIKELRAKYPAVIDQDVLYSIH